MLREWTNRLRLRLWILPQMHRTYRSLTLAETFQRIYRSKAWGSGPEAFYSGPGSGGPVSQQYCDAVVAFIRDRQVRSVVDLGCGDYNVGRRIVEATGVRYTGIDVVPELIDHHQSNVHDSGVSFQCADITRDPLPSADLCLIRQVLQHLSNTEIGKVLANVSHFPSILVSEDVPAHPKSFNRDKPHGPDVRAYFGSGVYPDEPPFSHPVQELWTIGLRNDAILRTVLLQPSAAASRD
jgi:SAM-dependent methyltransferase